MASATITTMALIITITGQTFHCHQNYLINLSMLIKILVFN